MTKPRGAKTGQADFVDDQNSDDAFSSASQAGLDQTSSEGQKVSEYINMLKDHFETDDSDFFEPPHTRSDNSIDHLSDTSKDQLDVMDILNSVSETVYSWSFSDDVMVWGPNADKILKITDPSHLSHGSAYSLLIDPKYISKRYDDIIKANAQEPSTAGFINGLPFRTKYRLVPDKNTSDSDLWVEDYGRVFMEGDIPSHAKGVVRIINGQYEEEQKLTYYSKYDEVTGLVNRFQLIQSVNEILSQGGFLKSSSAFLIAAIDNLKIINENFGFAIGDEVLSIVGRRMQNHMREIDVIGRFGSNKFGVLLKECGADDLQHAADRLMEVVRDNIIETSKGGLATSISLGGVLIPTHATTLQHVMSRALEALNQTKDTYHQSFNLYEPSEALENRHTKNSLIADEVVKALNEHRMCLALQPVRCRKTKRVSFYECLLRMRRPNGEICSAGEFIAVSEKLGISRLIDHRVLELALDLIRTHTQLKISMNVSGLTANDESWLDKFRAMTCADPSLAPRVIVEITETSAINDIEKSIEFVQTLKDMGCQVAIDDFGAGYSSFKILKLLGVDMVKIDGEFVKGLRQAPNDQIFIKTLVELAKTFNLETVAEWVADEATADILDKLGIGYHQGFLFGAPKMIEEYNDNDLKILPIPTAKTA